MRPLRSQMSTSPRIAVDDYDLARSSLGTAARAWLTVPFGLDRDLELPVVTVRGAKAGPIALLVAGVHGDEFEGVAALPRIADRLDPGAMSGTVIVLPMCNPFAYRAQTRATPESVDGVNLARAFPGDANGTPTARLASAIFSLTTRLLTERDLVVDLHSGGTRYRYMTLVGFRNFNGPARAASEEAARHFGQFDEARLWSIPDGRGMFNAETTRAGIPTVATEAPGQGQCREVDVRLYETGIGNLLRYLTILPDEPPPRERGPATCPVEVLADATGLFVTDCSTGASVEKGQRLGAIVDPMGTIRAEVRAPRAGEIWALRTFATVYVGELLAWVA